MVSPRHYYGQGGIYRLVEIFDEDDPVHQLVVSRDVADMHRRQMAEMLIVCEEYEEYGDLDSLSMETSFAAATDDDPF